MSDRLRQLEADLSDTASDIAVVEQLLASAGWKRLEGIAKTQLDARMTSILRQPLLTLDGALAQEYAKGETAGIELFMRLSEVELEQLKLTRENLLKEIEHETQEQAGNGGGSGNDGGSGGIAPELLDTGTDPFGGS